MEKRISELDQLPGGAINEGDLIEVVRGAANYKFPAENLGGGSGSGSNLLALAIAAEAATTSSMSLTPSGNALSIGEGGASVEIANATEFGFVANELYIVTIMSRKPEFASDPFDRFFVRLRVDGADYLDSQTVVLAPFATFDLIVQMPPTLENGSSLSIIGFQNYNYFNFAILGVRAV